MYQLVSAQRVSMTELKEVITLEEFMKLYAVYRMEKDIEAGMAEKARQEVEQDDHS